MSLLLVVQITTHISHFTIPEVDLVLLLSVCVLSEAHCMLGFVFIYIILFGFDCLHLLEYFGNGEQCQDKNNGEARDKELDT